MGRKIAQEPKKYCLLCKEQLHRKRFPNSLEDIGRFKKRKYCDALCMAKAMTRENVSRGAYLVRARKYKGKKCEECGTTNSLNIHHINENWKDNAPANLMTLCASCHLRLHWQNGKTMPKKPPVFCSVCGKKAEGLGYCMNHYRHFKKYGNPLLTKKSGRSDGIIIEETTTEIHDSKLSEMRLYQRLQKK